MDNGEPNNTQHAHPEFVTYKVTNVPENLFRDFDTVRKKLGQTRAGMHKSLMRECIAKHKQYLPKERQERY